MGPAFTVTSTVAVRMDAEANDWSETAQTSKIGEGYKWYRCAWCLKQDINGIYVPGA